MSTDGGELICGIDLGTTNSTLAFLRDGRPVAAPVEEDSAIMPSVVSLDEETGELIVGRAAKNRLGAFPEHTVRSVKRLMGKGMEVRLGGRTFSPVEISSRILEYLARRASALTGSAVRRTVITVPAYFNDAQRRDTIQAGEAAGLEVVRIVNEPTAAALVYDYVAAEARAAKAAGKGSPSPYIMVYDLGGGTLDVSILEVRGEIKQVLASCGDTALGGDDFDDLLAGRLLRHLEEKTGLDLPGAGTASTAGGGRAMQARLREIAERAKISLSDSPFVRVREVGVATAPGGDPVNLDLEIGRREYEEMIAGLVERTIEKVRESLGEANLAAEDIGEILLVGGATRTPLVQQRLSEVFARPMAHAVDPDLCVALGAAVQSGLIAGEPLGHILVDVTAHSLGVKTIDDVDPETGEADYFSIIIRRNTRIPSRKSEVYQTVCDDQEGVNVEVYQGESPSCSENVLVGRFFFDLKPAPEGSPVTTEFAYDREGIVHIVVDQKGRDNRKEVTLDVRRKKVLGAAKTARRGRDAGKERKGRKSKAGLRERGAAGAPGAGGAAGAGERRILNYILEKAKRLAGREGLAEEARSRLRACAADYEKALLAGNEEAMIDRLEGKLLDAMEEAEESTGGGGS